MRISPMDIEQQQFGRSFRGYNEEDVDNFLDRIAKDYEEVLHENAKTKEEMERIQARLDEYVKIEETLRTALVNAQQSASSIKESMQKEADNIIENAEIEAERIRQRAMQDTLEINNEITALKKRKFLVLEKLKNTLKLHIRMLEEELTEETDVDADSQYFRDKTSKTPDSFRMKFYPQAEQDLGSLTEEEIERNKRTPDL